MITVQLSWAKHRDERPSSQVCATLTEDLQNSQPGAAASDEAGLLLT